MCEEEGVDKLRRGEGKKGCETKVEEEKRMLTKGSKEDLEVREKQEEWE